MNYINLQNNKIKIISYFILSFYLLFIIKSFFIIHLKEFDIINNKLEYEEIIQNVFYISSNIIIENKKEKSIILNKSLNKKIGILNNLFEKNPILSGTGFLINKNIITADHVCQEINKFHRNNKKLEEIKNFIKFNLSELENLYFEENYVIKKIINIKNFNNTKFLKLKTMNIIKTSPDLDICIFKQKKYSNKKFKFRKNKMKIGEKVINFSFNDSFYKENVLPHNVGYFIGIFKNKNHYSLRVNKGSSGSLVFDKKYNIVGMIDSIYKNTSISMGSSSYLIYNFINPYNSIYSEN